MASVFPPGRPDTGSQVARSRLAYAADESYACARGIAFIREFAQRSAIGRVSGLLSGATLVGADPAFERRVVFQSAIHLRVERPVSRSLPALEELAGTPAGRAAELARLADRAHASLRVSFSSNSFCGGGEP